MFLFFVSFFHMMFAHAVWKLRSQGMVFLLFVIVPSMKRLQTLTWKCKYIYIYYWRKKIGWTAPHLVRTEKKDKHCWVQLHMYCVNDDGPVHYKYVHIHFIIYMVVRWMGSRTAMAMAPRGLWWGIGKTFFWHGFDNWICWWDGCVRPDSCMIGCEKSHHVV